MKHASLGARAALLLENISRREKVFMANETAMIDPQDFSYDDDLHEYRNSDGVIRPSVTQCLAAQGICSYEHVPKDVLENARRRGHNVHKWTQELDSHGFLDDTWVSEDEQPYVEAWQRFRHDIKPRLIAIEERTMGVIAGIEVGGTPDREAWISGTRYLLDLKCCASAHPGWALQLGCYEMLRTRRPRCGHLGRMSIRLTKAARYSITVYSDPRDADVAIAAVALTEWDSQANDCNADHARDTLNAWKRNHKLVAA